MIIFIYGADTFRSRRYLRQSIEQFKATRDKAGYNVVVLDGKKEEPGKIFSELTAAPFLAAKRLVVIEDILTRSDTDTLSQFASWIKDKKTPASTVVIFWQGEAVGKTKVAKELQAILAKEKYAQEFAPLKGVALLDSVQKEIAAAGGKIEPEALALLVANAGHDTWFLHSVIEQLLSYASARAIQVADIKVFTEEKLDDNIFSMVDALVAGKTKQALKLLNHQREMGEEEGKIFGLLVWQFRALLQIADMLEHEPGLTSDTLAKTIGLHPFVVKKNIALVRRSSLSALQAALAELLAIDTKTKTGAAPQSFLIDAFVAKIR